MINPWTLGPLDPGTLGPWNPWTLGPYVLQPNKLNEPNEHLEHLIIYTFCNNYGLCVFFLMLLSQMNTELSGWCRKEVREEARHDAGKPRGGIHRLEKERSEFP